MHVICIRVSQPIVLFHMPARKQEQGGACPYAPLVILWRLAGVMSVLVATFLAALLFALVFASGLQLTELDVSLVEEWLLS